MSNHLNNENVRVVGSMFDAIWVAPLGSADPTITSLDDLMGDALAEKLEAVGAENVGWLNEDGIPLSVSANNEEMYGHQGGSLLRSKVRLRVWKWPVPVRGVGRVPATFT